MQTIQRKLYKIIPVSFMLAMLLLFSVPNFAGTAAAQGRGYYDRSRGVVRVVNTRDGRRITYRRINGRWVVVRVVRHPNRYWNRTHRKMGDIGGYRPTYRRP